MFVSSRRHRATVPVDGSPAYTRRPRPGHHCQTRAPRRSTRGRGRIRVAEAPVGHQQPRAAAGAEPEFGRSPAKRCAPAAHLPTVCPSSSPSIEESARLRCVCVDKNLRQPQPSRQAFFGASHGVARPAKPARRLPTAATAGYIPHQRSPTSPRNTGISESRASARQYLHWAPMDAALDYAIAQETTQ